MLKKTSAEICIKSKTKTKISLPKEAGQTGKEPFLSRFSFWQRRLAQTLSRRQSCKKSKGCVTDRIKENYNISAVSVYEEISDDFTLKTVFGSPPENKIFALEYLSYPHVTLKTSAMGISENPLYRSRLIIRDSGYVFVFSSCGLETFSSSVREELSYKTQEILESIKIKKGLKK